MLELQDISKHYEQIKAVVGVSLEVKQGEVLAFVGPNGSGKSTLLKIMLGIIKPSTGRILFHGRELSDKDRQNFKRCIGYMPERVTFYENLTAKETLQLFARVKGGSFCSLDWVIHRILPEDMLRRKVGGFSKGMRQRLNLAQALLGEPEILILDEPTAGLDPVGIREFYDILEEVRGKRNLTAILSSHILAEIEDKTDRVAIIKNGSLRVIGRLEELYKQLKIPLRILITIDRRDETLERLLKESGAVDLDYKNGYLRADLPSDRKLEIIAAVMNAKNRFADISIREPSLEEVFFGVH